MKAEQRVEEGGAVWTQKQVRELLQAQRDEIAQMIHEAVNRDRANIYRPKFQAGMESVIELVNDCG